MINTKYFKTDILSGLVVFLVALPLCLGIALASGAPLFSGIIAGVIGGIVVGLFSNSQISVSGPAAGLTAIVITAITTLGGFEAFLLAVVLAGVFQLLLGFLKAGSISNYFPSNVIEGMLAAIGIIIILTQLPHAVGYDIEHEGDFFFIDKSMSHNIFSDIIDAVNYSHPGAMAVSIISVLILIAFANIEALKRLKLLPGALVVVIAGTLINEAFIALSPSFAISQEHLVNLPVPESFGAFIGQFQTPDFSAITNIDVWIVAITIAIVASIETLLCIEASVKMDPLKRFTNSNTELKAQGIGNILSGLIGGIPMTSVIVRTSANVNSGGRTKVSAIAHGIFLFSSVVAIPFILNKIPLASLAGVLIMIGYKLANPTIFKKMWKNGKYQFIPFAVTVVAIIATDLLRGIGIGLVVSVFFILRDNLKLAYFFNKENHHEGETIHIKLAQEVSFLNKAAIKQTLYDVPKGSKVIIDAADTVYIDHDVLNLIDDFLEFGSKDKEVTVELKGLKKDYSIENTSHVTLIES
ncbi:SulP family inorganic anion transporter [Acidiluteibacter ferrifornacis]|uniref:SulP family inorganic anion transporter n=1 Tax=Acidiluteibacter ferrifornacis TaxID=2692424 RepID=A0A6N9NLX0_9FLAO|nr:SulP family inorganic anion transporter [Acidiluteibacter ferrifornacis]NBG65565.1 SulP family inorganic anion transporter [Acidiluteibacter ferrifornacis]